MFIAITDFKYILLIVLFAQKILSLPCLHDHFVHSESRQKIFLNDFTDGRLLQGTQTGRLRIFVDYSQVIVGGQTEINTIKRLMNISSMYFYNLLNVTRLPRLYFPSDKPAQCSVLKIPHQYQTEGVIGDLGIVCGNQINSESIYIAKSISCVHLQSTKRPIWGMVMWNNNFLKFDQEGFQQILFVGIHQFTHILGFSAAMYQLYPKGNPLVQDSTGLYYLNTPEMQQQIKAHYGCNFSRGLPLEDQDGTKVPSHWQRKVVGNQYMIATNKKNSLVSRFSLILLNSTGWYSSVNFSYAQPMTWGKNKGCNFLNIDDCDSQQFCTEKKFICDHDGTGIGRCDVDPYTGSCMVPKYFVNTICVDQNYQIKNLNANLNALQRGGSSSRCFESNIRQQGLDSNPLNNRCYVVVCSVTGRSLYILIGAYILVCSKEGQIINAPVGLQGTLTCPKKFTNYCQTKKTCPYHCNKNGACINGRCQCTGELSLSASCADVSIFKTKIGLTGGLVNAFQDLTTSLSLNNLNVAPAKPTKIVLERQEIKKYSLDSKCIQGTVFENLFGECLPCQQIYPNCSECDDSGCFTCKNGNPPVRGNVC